MSYYRRLAEIESNNNPLAKNPNSSAKGRFQFIDSTAKEYGITAEFGTPQYQKQELEAVQKFTENNKRILTRDLGRSPTEGELYLAHQQGAGGALKLLKNPNASAVETVGQDAINLNGGNEFMTNADFASKWTGKFEGEKVTNVDAKKERLQKLRRLKELKDLKAQKQQESQQSQVKEERKDKNFFERVGDDLKKRQVQDQEIKSAFTSGEQGLGESMFQAAGVGAGTILDLGGEVAVSAFRELPEGVQNTVKSTGEFIAQSPLGDAARFGAEKYGEFAESNPRAARNIGSAANITSLVSPLKTKKVKAEKTPIEEVSSDTKMIEAAEPVRDNLNKIQRKEAKLYNEANIAGQNTSISGDVISNIPDKVQTLLKQEGRSLGDENLSELSAVMNKLNNFKREPVRSVGDVPVGGELKTPKVSEIIGIREDLSKLANSPDGRLRNASGKALREFDEALYDNASTAIVSGDKDAIQKTLKAIEFSKKKFKNFYTNKKKGQNVLFEKVITKQPIDNAQFADVVDGQAVLNAFGTNVKGKEATTEFITRLLANAGTKKNEVRQSLRDGFLYKAIEGAKTTGENGEILIKPNILAREINRLTNLDRSKGGLGVIRNKIFTTDELRALLQFGKKIENPAKVRGAIRDLATAIPVLGKNITPSKIKSQQTARKQTESFVSEFVLGIQPELKGQPVFYGSLIGTQQGVSSSQQVPNAGQGQIQR